MFMGMLTLLLGMALCVGIMVGAYAIISLGAVIWGMIKEIFSGVSKYSRLP